MANARSTWLTSYDEINKAQGIIDKRNAGAASLQVGQQLNGVGLAPGAPTPVANPYDKNHRDGIDAYYDDLVKKGVDPAKAADQIFQNTGVPPTSFPVALRGAMGSQDPQKAAAALTVADNMQRQNPNAFAGTPGQSDIESQVAKFRSFQEMGNSPADAAQKMIANNNADATNPVKKEQIDTFRKTVLTQDAIETRVKGLLTSNSPFSDKPSSVQLPAGLQRDTINGLYSEWAQEGFRQHGDQPSALAYADMEFQKQFGAQNGVITRYPPSKANLPSLLLPGQKDPLHWSYEQAAQETRDYLKSIGAPPEKYAGIDASQVIMTPVNQVVGGVRISTRSAFNGNPDTVYRSGGGDPAAGGAKQTSFQSIPYFIMINPKTPDQDPINVPHVFYPDVETYVADHNAQIATQPAAANGVGRGAAFHYPTPMMKTADQAQQDVYAQTAATYAASAQNNDYLNTTKANQISDLQSQLDLMPQNEFNKGSRDTLSAHIKILSEELGAQRRLESDGRKK